MEANELRKGNLLQGGKVLNFDNCVVKFTDKLHSVYGLNHPLCRPIPLTEQWLIDFGFERNNRIDVNLGMKKTPVWSLYSFSITIWDNGRLFYDWIGGNIEVKYLHQLQNLYFALIGEELKEKI